MLEYVQLGVVLKLSILLKIFSGSQMKVFIIRKVIMVKYVRYLLLISVWKSMDNMVIKKKFSRFSIISFLKQIFNLKLVQFLMVCVIILVRIEISCRVVIMFVMVSILEIIGIQFGQGRLLQILFVLVFCFFQISVLEQKIRMVIIDKYMDFWMLLMMW